MTVLSRLLVLVGLGATAVANAQLTSVTYKFEATLLNDPHVVYYPFAYDVKGSSLWGPGVPGTQTLDLTLPLSSPGWTQDLGAFYSFPVIGSFGAGIEAAVVANTSAIFHAKADLGSVDLHCTGWVGIIYPKESEIQGGQPFKIETFLVLDSVTSMNINSAHLGLKIDGHVDANLDLALVAKAFSDNIVDINLFQIMGLDLPTISGTKEILDTGNLLQVGQDFPLPIPPNLGNGYFHVPNLGASGRLTNDLFRARAADNVLTLNFDLTNLMIQYGAFGIPIPLNGDYSAGGFSFQFRILDLLFQAAAGIRQDFAFDPRPLIVFKPLGGQAKSVRAGGSVTFTAPSEGFLGITPTIVFDQNSFSDVTSLTLSPALSFDMIHVSGGGRVAGHNLFHFDIDPFGTQTAEDTIPLELFNHSFALPSPGNLVCPPFRVVGDTIGVTSRFGSITRDLQEDENGMAHITGSLITSFNAPSFKMHIEGKAGSYDADVPIAGGGDFSVYVPASSLGRYSPVTVTASFKGPNQETIDINPATINWSRPPLDPGAFGNITFDPTHFSNGNPVAYGGTGLFTFHLVSFNLASDATLLYDGVPIVTTRKQGRFPADKIFTGEVPGYLMDRGGSHTLSFTNSGINQEPVLLQTFAVDNPVPSLTDVLVKPSTAENAIFLFVRGSGFTVDSTVTIDGTARAVQLKAPTELRVDMLSADFVPGTHSVSVTNAAPGGGVATSSYKIAPIPSEQPSVTATHSMNRELPPGDGHPEGDKVVDQIQLTNAGKNVLRGMTVTSVQLLIKGKTIGAVGLPQVLPTLRPGNSSTVQVVLPPNTSVAGDIAILQIRGTVNGKSFLISNRVTMPGADKP